MPGKVTGSMDIIWLLKVILLVSVIGYLRVFGKQSLLTYVLSIIAFVFLKPANYSKAPEYILVVTIILLLGYILAISFNNVLRNHKDIKLEHVFNRAFFKKYIHFFSAMIIISFMLSFLNLQFIESILMISVFFIALEYLKINFPQIRHKRFLSYEILSIMVIAYLLFLSTYQVLIAIIMQSLLSCGLLMLFSLVRCLNTYVCPVNELREGMLPAETISIEENRFVKSDMPYISIPVYFRKKIADKVFSREEFVTPFKPLTKNDISVLKEKTDFEMLRIQKVIDMRIFLVAGIITTYFVM